MDRTNAIFIANPDHEPLSLAESETGAPADPTDDAGLVERLGERITTVVGDPLAFKITTPLDLVLARTVLASGVRTEKEM